MLPFRRDRRRNLSLALWPWRYGGGGLDLWSRSGIGIILPWYSVGLLVKLLVLDMVVMRRGLRHGSWVLVGGRMLLRDDDLYHWLP